MRAERRGSRTGRARGGHAELTRRSRLGREEWQEKKALCQYCQVATLASFAVLALALPEAMSAARTLAGRR